MKSFDRHGRLMVTSAATGITADYALNDAWPLIWNDDDGVAHFLRAMTDSGTDVLFLDESSPKVRDDDDGLYRWLRSTGAVGAEALYLSDEADTIPGKEAIVRNYMTGDLFRVRSRTESGVPTIYLEAI